MLILAIDTSTHSGSVALFDDKKGLIAEHFLNIKKNHSDTIMNAMDSILKYSEYDIDQVEKIVVATGPGSFTGIRVGVGIAKGLVFAKEKEIVGVNTLDLIANGTNYLDAYIMPMIDARKGRVYYSLYEYKEGKIIRIEDYKDGSVEEFLTEYKDKNILFTGDGSFVYKEIITNIMGDSAIFANTASIHPRASMLAAMGAEKEGNNPFTLEPYYHSKTQAEREKEEREKNL
jgi:N6-L-threonylcarbamoyladenine synthase